jgi:DNA-directed RNA polymerase specialized sigma24 family protein
VATVQFREGLALFARHAVRPSVPHLLQELERLQDVLRRYEPPRVNPKALESFFLRTTGETGRAFMAVAANASVGYERSLLHFLMFRDLRPTQREVISLLFGHHMTFEGVAIFLGIPVSRVKERLARGMRRLLHIQEKLERAGVLESDA